MSKLKNWSFRHLVKFLKDYKFEFGYTNGSHHFFNGKINGESRVVQAIFSSKEKKSQSNKTMEMAVKNSGIPKKYFEEWKSKGVVHDDVVG